MEDLDWMKRPYLFANGKFLIEYEGERFITNLENVRSFTQIIRACKLVARPASDLTRREIEAFIQADPSIFDKGDIEGVRFFLGQAFKNKTLNARLMIMLIDRGVYPFEPNETVILEHKEQIKNGLER